MGFAGFRCGQACLFLVLPSLLPGRVFKRGATDDWGGGSATVLVVVILEAAH